MMRQSLLPLVTFGLLALVVADRIGDWRARAQGSEYPIQGANDTRSATAHVIDPEDDTRSEGAAARAGDHTPDRLIRIAAREQLSREAGGTYLDSLIVSTDSVVRRWPDRWGTPLRVHIVEGGAPGYSPRMAGLVREAFDRWEQTGIGLRFQMTPDSAGADITVRWIDHFDFDRAGQTDLTWDQLGRVRRAAISLALRTHAGTPLPEAALMSVAVHEAGHAIGLPHSADTSDVMFPATRTSALTARDRRTVAVLYRIPPGPVREDSTRR
ncbi:MAG TPA: matrixin family metalloprotease [Gemmatimonadales bacterium]|nr:matrixin family metalloprotease [Gemmatimonadales bacterium]